MNKEIISEFLNNKKEKLDPICRVCLSENIHQARSVYEEYESSNIASIMMSCARVQIVCQDGLPDIICAQCFRDLEAANSFRVRCELSDSLLRNVYSNPDRSKVREKGEVTETHDVKEEVSCEPWIKFELENDTDSDMQYDPLVENDSYSPELNFKRKQSKKAKTLSNSLGNHSNSELKSNMNIASSHGGSLSKLEQEKDKKTKLFICKICGKPLKSKTSLERHIHCLHSEKKKLSYAHITGYGKDRKFNCFECSYSTHRQRDMIYHHRTHTGDKPIVCTICQACFSQHSALYSHMKVHSDKRNYTCSECGRQFKGKFALDRHKKVHDSSKHFICKLCSKGLKSKETLDIHMKRHLNIRNYSCEHCGRTFVCSMSLSDHMAKHAEFKKFECSICEFKTRLKRNLVAHVKRHSAERSFKCEHCEYTAYNIYAVKKHTRKHTREKNYSCPVCEMKFIHSSSVNIHMKRIHRLDYKINDHTDRRVVK